VKRYLVETRGTVRRQYFVDAENPKAAEEASLIALFDHEEDEDEQTMSITEIVEQES
jgi:hypothetical protein